MAKNRRSNKSSEPNIYLLILGIILAIFLLSKTTFFGALVTECDNIEPQSIIEYTDVIQEENGTLISDGNFTIQNLTLAKYLAESHLGTFELIVPINQSCSQLLADVNSDQNDTQYIVLNQRQVLTTSAGFMWCNYNNNIALRANSVTVLSNYYQKFEICTTTEIETPEYVTNESECSRLNGEFINNTCICPDGSQLIVGDACQDVDLPTTTGTTPSFTTTTPTPSTTTTTSTTTTSTKDYALYGLGILLILFALYWIFEKGPDKGLIKSKSRRRRR